MASDRFAPCAGEVQAIAELLRRRPDEITAIKLPGPGALVESPLTLDAIPEIDGFAAPEHFRISWDEERAHPAARYDSQHGSLVVVSHESGPALFFVVIGAA